MPKTMLLNDFSNSNTDSYFYHIKIKLGSKEEWTCALRTEISGFVSQLGDCHNVNVKIMRT